jgi:hypothetical protein
LVIVPQPKCRRDVRRKFLHSPKRFGRGQTIRPQRGTDAVAPQLRPHAPFAELVKLSSRSIADEMREEHGKRVSGD